MKRKIINIILLSIIILFMTLINNSYGSNKKMLGDINLDNKVDSRDQLLIMRHIMASARNTHPEWMLTGDKIKLADVTQNNKVDNSDMLKVLRYIAAKRNPEKIGNKHKEWLEIGEIDLNPEIEVDSIKLNKTNLALDMSGTKTAILIATIEPDNATNKSVTYSSNIKIATVDKDGKVTAKGNGTTAITVKSANGKTATCKVTVTTSPTSVKLNKTTLSLNLGVTKTATLKPTITPSTATNKKVTYSSSNTKVAAVDKSGKITSKGKGTAIITAKTSNKKSAKCTVTVKEGYWEIKNGKYIYHYLNGTKKTWTVSEYQAWKKLIDKKVKAKDPNAYKRKGKKFTYLGVERLWRVQDERANNLAKAKGVSPYAITVDIDRRHESIFEMHNGLWEPIKSAEVLVGGKWKSYPEGCLDTKTYGKNSLTPTGLFYTTGNNNLKGGNPPINMYWVAFGVKYTNNNRDSFGINGHGDNYEDYLHAPDNGGIITKGRAVGQGCVNASPDHAKWIYEHCGRGTPVLIW